jgi:hypothetical protein
MKRDKEELVSSYRDDILVMTDDLRYKEFIKSLNPEELEIYLFFEAQRANVFVQELTTMKGYKLSITDLIDKKNRQKINDLINNNAMLDDLIDFWDKFSSIDDYDKGIIDVVIDKYDNFYKPLTDLEKQFFRDCFQK